MTPEDKAAIIDRFAEAIKGRFGPLKPAQAIERCFDYITELRDGYLAWAEIEPLFNLALVAQHRPQLRQGSLSRLYRIEMGRRPPTDSTGVAGPTQLQLAAATPRRVQAAAAAAPTPSTGTATTAAQSAEEALPATAHARAIVSNDEAEIRNTYLKRIEERREAKKRMDEA